MQLSVWPQSLFGRLIAASALAVLLAHATGLLLIAQEREHFVLQGSVREWSRRIAEITFTLQAMNPAERAATIGRLSSQRGSFGMPPAAWLHHGELHEHGWSPEHGHPPDPPHALRHEWSSPLLFIHMPLLSDFEPTFRQQLRAALGASYQVSVAPSADLTKPAIAISAPFFEAHELQTHQGGEQPYDITVRFPDSDTAVFRVTRMERGAPLPRNLVINLILLVIIMVVVLYVAARSITRPLSELARAADSLGRGTRQPKLAERGARELRDAARAFNTMQDRLRRYLDSRTRVLAAMSHDLKTPLTRLRLQVEMLENPALQARIGKELDEMESMVREALALFRGLDDEQMPVPIDVNGLLANLQAEFSEMGAEVSVVGSALQPFTGKPQALKRCLTNLVANAVKFGTRALILVEDGAALLIRVRDEGPGIPAEELERVFEPFYRIESSRNRDTGGTGLGLSIARDIAQAHAGSLTLGNLAQGGLEALLTLPRPR